MLSIIGTVLKKEKKNKTAELVVQDDFGNDHAIQVRQGKLPKIVFATEGSRVQVFYKNEMAEKFYNKECKRFNNLILLDLKLV